MHLTTQMAYFGEDFTV